MGKNNMAAAAAFGTDPRGQMADGSFTVNPPLVLITVSGGIAEEWVTVEGTGKPVVYILDFDREGEDDGERAWFIEAATEALDAFRGRGIDVSGAQADVDKMKRS